MSTPSKKIHPEVLDWKPLLTIKPNFVKKDNVELNDPINKRRADVNVKSLFKILAKQYIEGEDITSSKANNLVENFSSLKWMAVDDRDVDQIDGIRWWWSRGWQPSIEYYLWSRKRDFSDQSDPEGKVRREVLSNYLEIGPPPKRLQYTEGYKQYVLPEPARLNSISLGDLMMSRRSIRAYEKVSMSQQTLSKILFYGTENLRKNIVANTEEDVLNYLSSHGVAFEIFMFLYDVEGIVPGIYHYNIISRELTLVYESNLREKMCDLIMGMKGPSTANITILLTADYEQYQWRYRHERAFRHLLMAGGRVAQRLITVAQSERIGTLPTPALKDSECAKMMGIDPVRHGVVYTLTMGKISDSYIISKSEIKRDQWDHN